MIVVHQRISQRIILVINSMMAGSIAAPSFSPNRLAKLAATTFPNHDLNGYDRDFLGEHLAIADTFDEMGRDAVLFEESEHALRHLVVDHALRRWSRVSAH